MSTERAFVFADLAGYTALTEAHGDHDAAHIAMRFHELALGALHGDARIVKTIGDAVMLVSATPVDAIDSSLALAREVAASCTFPAVRIGIHVGSAVERDGDYFGGAVNIAARVSCMARGGEIVCTEAIAEAAVAHRRAAARPMGTFRLKNVAIPVALYELASTTDKKRELAHIDPVCRMQVIPEQAAARTVHDGVTFYFCSAHCAATFDAAPESHLPTP
ncbi:MAG TPA: YHS domain-containing protein [Kofleriaceae bacterium]|nr:YHS domain-containing protein [Kofleriaceae bacterium]